MVKAIAVIALILAGCGDNDCPVWCRVSHEIEGKQVCFVGPSCGVCTTVCSRISRNAALAMIDAGQCQETSVGNCR